jgi:hypothetical protein
VTRALDTLDGSFAWNKGVMRTEPVKYWADPVMKGCKLLRGMVMVCASAFDTAGRAPALEEAVAPLVWRGAEASRKSAMAVAMSRFIFRLLDAMMSG